MTTSASQAPSSGAVASTGPASWSHQPCASWRTSAGEEARGGVGEDGLGLVGQLVELLAAADQRRRQVQHRVPAVVGPRDQPLLEQPAGEEAPKSLLRFAGGNPRAAVVRKELDPQKNPAPRTSPTIGSRSPIASR